MIKTDGTIDPKPHLDSGTDTNTDTDANTSTVLTAQFCPGLVPLFGETDLAQVVREVSVSMVIRE